MVGICEHLKLYHNLCVYVYLYFLWRVSKAFISFSKPFRTKKLPLPDRDWDDLNNKYEFWSLLYCLKLQITPSLNVDGSSFLVCQIGWSLASLQVSHRGVCTRISPLQIVAWLNMGHNAALEKSGQGQTPSKWSLSPITAHLPEQPAQSWSDWTPTGMTLVLDWGFFEHRPFLQDLRTCGGHAPSGAGGTQIRSTVC